MGNPDSGTQRRWFRPIVLLLVFAAAFLGARAVTASVEMQLVGGRDADVFTGKFDHLAENIDQYDTVYIGASRAFRGFKATDFDAAMAEAGVATSSFNMGIPGLNGLEAMWVARRVLEMDGENLQRLIVGPEFGPRIRIDQRLAHLDRVVIWHDLEGTSTALQAVWQGEGSLWQKTTWTLNNIDAYAINQLAIGRFSSRLAADENNLPSLIVGPMGDGHVSLDFELATAPYPDLLRRQEVNSDVEQFDRILKAVTRARSEPLEEPLAWERSYVERMIELGHSYGVDIVFVSEPAVTRDRDRFLRWMADRDDQILFLDFSDPSEYPGLYEWGYYFDRGHVNDLGASRFTTALAEALLPILSGGN